MNEAMRQLEQIGQAAITAILATGPEVAPRHQALYRRWQQIPATTARPDLSLVDQLYAELGFPQRMADFHRAALGRLPELLRDEITVQDLLFTDGDVLAALAAYQTNTATQRLNDACADLVRAANPRRVLEIGGGAGGTTAAVLAAHSAEYLFTDVSPLFTVAAANRFGVRTALLDINSDPAAQGFAPASADLIVAGNVLHNAIDLRRTLGYLRSLLAVGGELVFTESTRDNAAVLTSMHFLLSPPEGVAAPGSGDRRAATGEMFLDAEAWAEELVAAGFEPQEVELAEQPGGQRLFHAVRAEAAGQHAVSSDVAESHTADWSAAHPAEPEATAPHGAVEPNSATAHPGLDPAALVSPRGLDPAALAVALGPHPGRTALLLPDPAAEQAIAATGGILLPTPPDLTPATVLAFLERTEASTAVLPGPLADALATAPTAPLTDLDALQRLICLGPTTVDLSELAPRIVLLEPQRADLAEIAAQAGDQALHGLDLDLALRAIDGVSQICLHAMRDALPQAAEIQHPLSGRWRKALSNNGITGTTWAQVRADWQQAFGSAHTVDYARQCADQLTALLNGTANPVELLFPQGKLDLARALYRESVTARYQRAAIAAAVARLATERGPLRILEVGAGTGGTTAAVLPALRGHQFDYLFTDVSKVFLDQARREFGDTVGYARYDIDAAPAQGLDLASFDVIIAGGVLNAAAHTDTSVRWLTELLTPGGWLLLTEPTVEEHWVLISQGFLLTEPRDARAESGSTFLTLAQWHAVLDGAGLRREADLPGPAHPLARLGHHVFLTRSHD